MDHDLVIKLYEGFQSPIAALDCGKKCAPYNEGGVPFCCDTRHAVPTAYCGEWDYLQANTDLWHPWEADESAETERLRAEAPPGQILIECQGRSDQGCSNQGCSNPGHLRCQRNFRALTCRVFPFFPYIAAHPGDGNGFIGLSYYWEYEDRCWVISNLQVVSAQFVAECVAMYDQVFAALPSEYETYAFHSKVMRRFFGHRRRSMPLLHRDGGFYEVDTRSGELRPAEAAKWPKFGPYEVAEGLPFPDEL